MAEDKPQQQTPAPAPPTPTAAKTTIASTGATQPQLDWTVDPSIPNTVPNVWIDITPYPTPIETYGPPNPNAQAEAQNRYSRQSDSASFPVTDPGANQPETGLPGIVNNGIPVPGGNRVEIRGRKPTLVIPF